jgi:CheY-like chemotaxis protein
LSELTDVLEAQTERIETIERQLGDSEGFGDDEEGVRGHNFKTRLDRLEQVIGGILTERSAAGAGTTERAAGAERVPQAPESTPVGDVLAVMMDRMDEGFAALGRRMERVDSAVSRLVTLTGDRDRHIRELEERLLILVDTEARDRTEREPAGVEAPASPRLDETRPAASEQAAPSPRPAGDQLTAEFEKVMDREVLLLPGRVAAASEGRSHLPHKARPTVMIVDAAADARTLLSMYLSKTGFQVVTAASAEDCLAKLRHHDVDAIVLDAGLPGADGGHVCSVLRTDPTFIGKRHTPVIVYAGYGEEESRRLATEWAADDYVTKGGDMLPLISSLLRFTATSEATSGP